MGKNEWDEPAPGSAGDRLANWNRNIRDEQRRNSPQAQRKRAEERMGDVAKPPKAQRVETEQTGTSTAWLYLAICVLFDITNAIAWVLTQLDLGQGTKLTICILFAIGGASLCYLASVYKSVLLAAWLVQIGVFVILIDYALHISS